MRLRIEIQLLLVFRTATGETMECNDRLSSRSRVVLMPNPRPTAPPSDQPPKWALAESRGGPSGARTSIAMILDRLNRDPEASLRPQPRMSGTTTLKNRLK